MSVRASISSTTIRCWSFRRRTSSIRRPPGRAQRAHVERVDGDADEHPGGGDEEDAAGSVGARDRAAAGGPDGDADGEPRGLQAVGLGDGPGGRDARHHRVERAEQRRVGDAREGEQDRQRQRSLGEREGRGREGHHDEQALCASDDVLRRPAQREQPAGEAAQAPQPVQDGDEPERAVRLGEVDDAQLRRPDAEAERDRDDEQRAHAGVGDRAEDRRRRAARRPPTDRVSGSAPNAAVTAPQPSPVATSAASGDARVAAVTSTSGPMRNASSCSEASSVTIRPNASRSSIRPQTTREEADTGGSARPHVSATAA